MSNTQITELRQLLAAIATNLKECKTHVRGITAYRSDADGLAYAVNKFQAAAGNLRTSAENLESLAADLTSGVAPASTTGAHNGRETETLA
jgi:hypothetical protein